MNPVTLLVHTASTLFAATLVAAPLDDDDYPNGSMRKNGSFRARAGIGTSAAGTVSSGGGVTRLLVLKAERSGGNYTPRAT